MPIRINLLAEAQAEEEMRRKDPVKRAWLGGFVAVGVALSWSGILQLKIIASSAILRGYEARWKHIEKDYNVAVQNQKQLMDAEQKLTSLEQLRTNRFLWGNALNAFQQTLVGIDQVRVLRLKVEQKYLFQEGTKPKTNGTVEIKGKAPTALQQISLTLEAKDASPTPGANVNRFKEAIVLAPYFQEGLQKTNGVLLTSLSPPQTDAENPTPFVKFTLQCNFPEKVR